MRLALEIAQLVLYIALLAMLGQGALYVLAGPKRDANLFYRLLQVVGSPFTGLVRRMTPKALADRHVALLTFALLLIAYVAVTFERISLCLQAGVPDCR